MNDWFSTIARRMADWCGSSYAFILAVAVVIVWAITGPVFAYSDTWQLLINTGTTVVTFLMVFLLQNTQARDTLAIQIKLDELIHATREASDRVMRIEDLSDAQLRAIRERGVP